MAKSFLFQTAKTMANTLGKDDSQSNNESNTNIKFIFQKAGAVIQSSSSLNEKSSEDVAEKSDQMEIDYDQIPFSEEQIKEFGGHSNIMLGFQTAKQCESGKSHFGFTSDGVKAAPSCNYLKKDEKSELPTHVEEPIEVLEDINKILSKYDECSQSNGPKKKVVFNKKNTSKSKSCVIENITLVPNVQACPVFNATTTTDGENFAKQSSASSNIEDFDKKKIVFGRKLRCRKSVNYQEITHNDERTEACENYETKCEEDNNAPKKKLVFKRPSAGATKEVPRQLVDSFPDTDDEDFKSSSDRDSDVLKIDEFKEQTNLEIKPKTKKKVVFRKTAKKSLGKTVFKVPDTEEFLKIKEKTQRATSNAMENSPQKVTFGQARTSKIKKSPPVKSNSSEKIGNPKVVTRNQSSTVTKESQSFKGPVLGTPSAPKDAKVELSALDKKPVRAVLAKARNLNRRSRQVIAASASSVCEPEVDGPEFFRKKPKVEIQKPVDVPVGPPIEVPKCLPDLLDAYTTGGQRVLFSPNEDRPRLFQSKAEAVWWDAATYTNFRRMKHALERGDYIHPQLSRRVEEEVKEALGEIERRVEASVRHLESRTLTEKYILCQWEASLISGSCAIDQWLHEGMDMSPCAMNALSRQLDRLLGIPVTLVMIKKTMYLTTLLWNLCDLCHGMWAQDLAEKANAVLQHFKESLSLAQTFTKAHYESALFDLIADFRLAIEPLPFHERLLITHTLDEEHSWTRRETLILNTKPDANETTLDDYEFTENDRKNLVILKLLLKFPNEISEPIFLPRNRTAKPPKKSFGFKECSIEANNNLPVKSPGTDEVEEYDYYDNWNFKTIPKRINRSVGKTKVDINLKPIINNGDAYKVNGPTLNIVETTRKLSDKIINVSNNLDTFDYNNAEDVVSKKSTIVKETLKELTMNVSSDNNEKIIENEMMYAQTIIINQGTKGNELMCVDNEMDHNYPTADINQPYSSYNSETKCRATETQEFLSDTFRILHDESNEHYMETIENNSIVENLSDMIQDTFNSQDLKLIYNILESENLVEAVVPELDTAQTNNDKTNTGFNDSFFVDTNNNVTKNSQSQEDKVPDVSTMEDSDDLYIDETAQLYEDKGDTIPCDMSIKIRTPQINMDAMIVEKEELDENNNQDIVNTDKTAELIKDKDSITCDLPLVIKWLES